MKKCIKMNGSNVMLSFLILSVKDLSINLLLAPCVTVEVPGFD